ncbi:hypothetical protein B7486_64760, partial [cyanobacterium TDX16]
RDPWDEPARVGAAKRTPETITSPAGPEHEPRGLRTPDRARAPDERSADEVRGAACLPHKTVDQQKDVTRWPSARS